MAFGLAERVSAAADNGSDFMFDSPARLSQNGALTIPGSSARSSCNVLCRHQKWLRFSHLAPGPSRLRSTPRPS